MDSIFDTVQFSLDQIHGQYFVLVTSGGSSSDTCQSSKSFPGSFLDEPVGIVDDVGDGQGGWQSSVHEDDHQEHGDQVEQDQEGCPCRQLLGLLLVLVIVRIWRSIVLY